MAVCYFVASLSRILNQPKLNIPAAAENCVHDGCFDFGWVEAVVVDFAKGEVFLDAPLLADF